MLGETLTYAPETPISLLPGENEIVYLTVKAEGLPEAMVWNYAEISEMTDMDGNIVEDIDSAPDADPNNDGWIGGSCKDNVIDEDAKANPGVDDEDDHDFAKVNCDDPMPSPSPSPSASPAPSSPPAGSNSSPRPSALPSPVVTAPPVSMTPSPRSVLMRTPEQLPNGYIVQQINEDEFLIIDENGMPLGTIKVPSGSSLDELDIWEELVPFGKLNSITSDGGMVITAFSSMFLLGAAGLLLVCKERIKR